MTITHRLARTSVFFLWCLPVTAVSQADTRILAAGAPGTYQIISIPIPDQLPRRGVGRAEIVPRDGFTVLGAAKWSLTSFTGKTQVVGIIGIPANARAGLVTAAEVHFVAEGAPIVVLTVDVEISVVRELSVKTPSAPLRGRAGGTLVFSYELVNSGNATESVETRITAPTGWRMNQRSGSVISVEAHASAARRVMVTIPQTLSTGSFFLQLDVLDKAELRNSIPVTVEILDRLSSRTSAGPEVTIAVARAGDASGRGSVVTTTSIRGPLFDSVRIDARYSIGERTAGSYGQVLSRLGSYRSAPSLILSSPSGRLSLGAAGTSFSDLTGLNAYGNGAALSAHGPLWRLNALGAMSNNSSASGKSLPMAGLRGELGVGALSITSSLSHLREGDGSRQQLDAVGVGASLEPGFQIGIQGEIARRRFAEGSGTGWSTQIARIDPKNTARIRITHAPGGRGAFARAADEAVADVSQSLSRRLAVSGGAWRSSDSNAAFTQLRSSGWTIRPEYQLHSSTAVAVEVDASDFDAVSADRQHSAAGAYGGAERKLGASISSSVRQFHVSGTVARGYLQRTIGATSAGSAEAWSPKIWWSAQTSWRGPETVVEVQGRLDEMRDVSGLVSRQSQISLRGKQRLGFMPRGTSVDGEVQQVRGFSTGPVTVVRTGVALAATERLAVVVYAERNALFTTAASRSPWILALRVEHSTRVPMVRVPGSTGHVYRDLNGNQKRDVGEPGVEGAIVKRGSETAVTDAGGRYRLAGDTWSAIVLDEASLPLGWVRQTPASPDMAVGPSLRAEIRFVIAPRSGIQVVDVDLSGIRVIARDSAGREWMARMTGPRVASFDAIPPGTYELEIDFSGLSEPLVPRTVLPPLRVTPLEPSVITVVLDPRPLRMWRVSLEP